MSILAIIGLVILCVVLLIGTFRIISKPYTGFLQFLNNILLLDLLVDFIFWSTSLFIDDLDND